MRCGRRKTCRNHTRNQRCAPIRTCVPETLDALITVVREAERHGHAVRAVGHSWSDVALTGGYLLQPSGRSVLTRRGLNRPLDLEPELLSEAGRSQTLIRAEAGMRVRAN